MEKKPIVVAFPFAGDDFGGSDISAVQLISSLDREWVKPIVMLHSHKGDA